MKYLYFLIPIIFCFSCEKEKSDDNSNNRFVIKILSGDKQTGFVNQVLDSSVYISINNLKGKPYNSASISNGSKNGDILKYIYGNKGVYKISWLLGGTEGPQKLSLVACDSLKRLIDTVNISATAKKDILWNRSAGLPLFNDFTFGFPTIQKFAEHPDGTIYYTAYSFSAGLYSSNDAGASWSKYYDFSTLPCVYDLSINSDGTIFLSALSGLFQNKNGSGWSKIFDGLVNKCFVIDNKTMIIEASNTNNIYRSDDGGLTWNLTAIRYSNLNNVTVHAEYIKQIVRVDKDQILLLDDTQLLLSKDNGSTWTMINGALGSSSSTGFIVQDNYIYVMNVGGTDNAKIYKSSISNISWSLLCTLRPRDTGIYYYDDIYSYNNNLYFLCGKAIYRVSQNGDTLNITKNVWSKIQDVGRFMVTKNGYLILGSMDQDQGIFYTNLNLF